MKRFIKLFSIIFALAFAITLYGCGENFDKFLLHFSSQSIELGLGESKDYQIEIENYFKTDIHFDYNFDSDIASVEKTEEIEDGVFKIEVKALMSGNTTLTITLLENNTKIQIPVKVYEDITSFALKDNLSLYVLRGQAFSLSEDMFNFYPSSTLQTKLNFTINGESVSDGVYPTDENTPNSLSVVAQSAYNEDLSVEFDVVVLDEINVNSLENTTMSAYNRESDKYEDVKPTIDENPGIITIIPNDNNEYIKKLQFIYNADYDYEYQFLSKNGNIVIDKEINSNFENAIGLNLQFEDGSSDYNDELIVRINHKGYTKYYVELTYRVGIKLIPKNIKLNGNSGNLYFNLFDNNPSENTQEILVSLDPMKAEFSQINIKFALVDALGNETTVTYRSLKQYICVKYKGFELNDDNNALRDSSGTISIYGQRVLDANYKSIRVTFEGESALTKNVISNTMDITIQKGAKAFRVDEKYKNATIYIKKGDEQLFDGLIVEEQDAYIGDISVFCDTESSGYSIISQVKENDKQIKIEAVNVGKTTYTLTLSNGIKTRLTVIVKEELNINDFMLYVSSNTDNGIAEIKYKKVKDTNVDTIQSIDVAGSGMKFDVAYVIKPSNVDTDMYSVKLTSDDASIVEVINNKTIRTVSTSTKSANIVVSVTYQLIEDFDLVEHSINDTKAYNFTIKCFEPLSSFSVSGKNDGNKDEKYKNIVDIYNDTPYIDKLMASASLNASAITSSGKTDKELIKNISWSFSVESTGYTENGQETTDITKIYYYELTEIGGSIVFGKFYPQTQKFSCEESQNCENLSFEITGSINNYGQVWSSSVQINIKPYVKVTDIWIKNYTPKIYLDATNNEYVIYPYVVPENATNVNYTVQVSPDADSDLSSLSYIYDAEKITLKYSGGKGGRGKICIIPYSSYTSDGDYDYSLEIEITIGNGLTKDAPLHISTWQELKTIDLNKHYVIDGIIDANNEEIEPLGILNGGIKGENGARIQNFVIKKPKNIQIDSTANYYGLFSIINANAYIEDLVISGKINIQNENSNDISYVGLVAGLNKSNNINNVNVILQGDENSKLALVKLNGNIENYIGGFCGYNEGTIKITLPCESTLLVSMADDYTYQLELTAIQGKYYFGGVVGYNKGTIKFDTNNNTVYRYNDYGTIVAVNLNVNVPLTQNDKDIKSCIGGVVGFNDNGIIDNILIRGNIHRLTGQQTYRPNYVGGIAGYAKGGKYLNCITRVFVAGYDNIAGLIGYIECTDDTEITKCKVQALDSGKTDLNATMILSYNGVNYNKFCNGNDLTSIQNKMVDCIAETYIDRTLVTSKTESLKQYYGDILCWDGSQYTNGEKFVQSGEQSVKIFKNYYNSLNYPNNTIILMYYDSENTFNEYVEEMNKCFLPNDLFNDSVLEYTIISSDTSIISVEASGKLLIHSVGNVTLTLQNKLNIQDKMELKVVVTNYISRDNPLNVYSNTDRVEGLITQDMILQILNRNTTALYPKVSSLLRNLGLTLVENTDVKIKILQDSNDYLTISQTNNNIIYLTGKGNKESTDIQNLYFYIYYDLGNGDIRYFDLENGVFVPAKEENNKIVLLNDANEEISPVLITKYNFNLGIYELNVDKTSMTLAPMDDIDINISYKSLSDLDKIILEIYYINGDYIEKIKTDDYFDITIKEIKDNEFYKFTYNIAMKISNIKIGNYRFRFVNSTGSLYKNVEVSYIFQPINNIVVKNYNDIENKDIVTVETNGKEYYNTSYAMQESDSVVAGGVNILRINVAPYYADFDYVEITNSANNVQTNKILMFSLLKNSDKENKKIISTDSYYTSNGIRIYKNAVLDGDITLLYKLYTNVIEGDIVDISVNFYNNKDEKVFETYNQSFVVDINKSITVTLKDRDSQIRNDIKYIARGYSYGLDVQSIGYNLDEIKIIANSPYLSIIKDGNNYGMKVSEFVTYGSGENDEGAQASLSYYGERIVNGQKVQSSFGTISFTIVEYVLDIVNSGNNLDISNLIDTDPLELNVKNTVKDVRTLIADKIKLENTNSASNAVKKLKQDIINNAYFEYQSDRTGNIFARLTDTGSTKTYNDEYVSIDGYSVTPKHIGENVFSFRVLVKTLQYRNGYIKVTIDEGDVPSMAYSQIGVNINQSISSKNYLPIRTYDEFVNMKENCKYRLLNDIVIETSFSPITTNIKELDGNGYSLILRYNYILNDVESFGIFDEIGEDTIIKNLTVKIDAYKEVDFTFENSSNITTFNFGLFASSNKGVITNCEVTIGNNSSLLKVYNYAPVDITASSNISAFVAKNEGYITNSRVQIRIESEGGNLSGFVGDNDGHIASCYVKGSYIRNNSADVKSSTAGFVKTNNLTIMNSYVEGKYGTGNKKIYCDDTTFSIRASSIASTFVYNNKGKINDCYANIPIVSSSQNSGFVCINEGTIENAYTTSRLGDNDTQNYPFFITNSAEIKHCYYLSDDNFNINVNKSNDGFDSDILRKTSLLEFALNKIVDSDNRIITNEELFSTFVFNGTNKVNHGVWFYANNEITETLLKNQNNATIEIGKQINVSDFYYLLRKVNSAEYISVDEFKKLGNSIEFVSYRPQLVSANELAYSHLKLSELDSKLNEETGEIDYVYELDGCEAEGSLTNPILIYSATELESEIYNSAKLSKNIYTKSIRLAKDINYISEDVITSSLYKVTFAGKFEGNGLKVSGYALNTTESLFSAGFFSQIGYQGQDTLFQNVVFEPIYINMPNVRVVGAVCGLLFKADVYNVEVNGEVAQNKTLVVIGKNIVGGLFGRTLNDYEIKNVKSSVSVNATNVCKLEDWTTESAQSTILFNEITSNISTVSYSGTVIGYVGGFGYVQNASTNDCASIGMVSGLMFGGIGINATVSYITINPLASTKCFVYASVYGGILAGEIRGVVNYVDINLDNYKDIEEYKDTNGNIDGKYYDIFKNANISAQAVGGLCGLLKGEYYSDTNINENNLPSGTINNCEVKYNINSYKNAKKTNIAGGLVGKVAQNGTIINSSFKGDVSSIIITGGFIGKVELDTSKESMLNIIGCDIGEANKNSVIEVNKPAAVTINNVSVDEIFIGSIIGCVSGEVQQRKDTNTTINLENLNINTSYKVRMTVYGKDSTDIGDYVVWDFDIIGGVMSSGNLQGEFIQNSTSVNKHYIIKYKNSSDNVVNVNKDRNSNYNLSNLSGNNNGIISSSDDKVTPNPYYSKDIVPKS